MTKSIELIGSLIASRMQKGSKITLEDELSILSYIYPTMTFAVYVLPHYLVPAFYIRRTRDPP